MKKNNKIGIIGCGNMGQVILAQSLQNNNFRFTVYEKSEPIINMLSARYVAKKHAIKIATSVLDLVSDSDIIVIAVKPQDIEAVLDKISDGIKAYEKNKILIISIAAGINTEYIEKKMGNRPKVIRAMPNMPASIGEGITALIKGQFANGADLGIAKNIFNALGPTIEITQEKLMDVVTALSGSGPAYLFFIFCAMLAAAKGLGLDKKTAKTLIYHTVIGSMRLLKEEKFDAESLIVKVASKGGATEAALKVFKENKLNEIIFKGIITACKRAKKLSGR